MEEPESLFVEFFGDYPLIRVLDFLIENRILDYTKTEIAKDSSVGWSTLHTFWDKLEKFGIVKPTRTIGRAQLFKLNEENPVVQKLVKLDMDLTLAYAEKVNEKEVEIAQ